MEIFTPELSASCLTSRTEDSRSISIPVAFFLMSAGRAISSSSEITRFSRSTSEVNWRTLVMKKTLLISALVAAAFAFITTNSFAWNNWGSGGYGMMNGGYHMMGGGYSMMTNYRGNVDNEAYRAFQKDTATIRLSMAADEAELDAVMAGSDPDPTRARALAESIAAKQSQLAEAAQKSNLQLGNSWYCGSW